MKFSFAVATFLSFQISHGAIFRSVKFSPVASKIDPDANDVCKAQTVKA